MAPFLLDSHDTIISWNRAAEKINGYRADEVISRHFSIFYPKEAIKKSWPQYELMIARAEGPFEGEGCRMRKEGSQYWAHVTISAVKDEIGDLTGFLKIVRDLTARKKRLKSNGYGLSTNKPREHVQSGERKSRGGKLTRMVCNRCSGTC